MGGKPASCSAAAEQLAGFPPIEIGQAYIEQHEIDMAAPRLFQPVAGGRGKRGFEFLVQRELLAQGLAKLVVIVDDEDLARVAHRRPLA